MKVHKNLLLPSRGVISAITSSAIAICIAAWLSTQQPWLGVQFGIDSANSIVVERVIPGGPAEGKLEAGDKVVALLGDEGARIRLKQNDLAETLLALPTFEHYQHQLERHKVITSIISRPHIEIVLSDNETITLNPSPSRPISSIPLSFWFTLLVGLTGFIIASITLLLQHRSIATQTFFVAGLALQLSAWGAAIYAGRELAIDTTLAAICATAAISGEELLAISLVALIWAYPKPISHLPAIPILYGLASIDILRIIFLSAEMPLHSFFFGLIIAVPTGILLSTIQWWRSRDKPDDRAILKWVNLSIYIAVFLIMGTFYFPIVLSGKPLISVASGHAIVTVVFLGFAFAITRYRLFDIERWWIDIWLWLFAGLLIVATDLVLASVIKLNHGIALGIALIITGWVYFPLRQAVWRKIFKLQSIQLEGYLPKIVTALTRSDGNIEELWLNILRDIFNPLTVERGVAPVHTPSIDDDGLALMVPGNENTDGYTLRYADKGRRLFLEGDIQLTESLFNLVFDKQRSFASYMRGVHEERKRIVRDLHDDVAGRLLAMKLTTHDKAIANPANEALTALRSIIYSLNQPREKTLGEASTRWRTDLSGLIEPGKTLLTWDVSHELDGLALTPHNILNLERILRESFTNAIRHSKPEEILVRIAMSNNNLELEVKNNGNTGTEKLQPGNGLLNIKQRMQEMGGTMTFTDDRDNHSFHLKCLMPMEFEQCNEY